MQHTRCYVNLKERAIQAMVADYKTGHPRTARVLALTGIRRAESARRRSREDITKRGGLVFANPLIDWTGADLRRYRSEHAFPESDVAALLHRSGECNCGAYAAPGEREMLRSLFPEWFEATIAPLERAAVERGLEITTWGAGREFLDQRKAEAAGPMCSDCQLRFEAEA
jgi:3'-phosphoadenosine 5'-phosphosulfate sulfotransferase (PAPS reductase)/FAD synthetase